MGSLTLILAVLLHITAVFGGPYEVQLINDLLETYNGHERPAEVDNTPLKVEFNVQLNAIYEVNEKNQKISTTMWLKFKYNDWKLRWNPADYANITDIRLHPKYVWKPDVILYNSADETFDTSWPVNMIISYNGDVEQLPPGVFTSDCPINIRWFPFDDQTCILKFGSWTYDGTRIDLQPLGGATSANLGEYTRNAGWDLIEMPVVRNNKYYDCCPDNPYPDLTFYIRIRRRKLYYMVNIIIPCLMLACLTLVTFTIPSDAGEKISFGVTILLSLTVFLLMVAEALPASSDAVPLIALYFSTVMMLNAASVVGTVLVLSYHHRSAETHSMPNWVKKGICEYLAWILRLDRPDHQLGPDKRFTTLYCGWCESHGDDIEMQDDIQGQSLLSNIKNDPNHSPTISKSRRSNGTTHSKDRQSTRADSRQLTGSTEGNIARYELRCILKELRYLTDKMKADKKDAQVTSDWKFAATVIDRLLLWVFTISTALSTFVILLGAPNMFSSAVDVTLQNITEWIF